MGGLIAKQYLSDPANAGNVRMLVFVATPHLGAPKALKALRYGDDLDVILIDPCKLKRAGHNYPSLYNLLPGRRYFEVTGGGFIYDDDDLDGDGETGFLDFAKSVSNLRNGRETRCLLDAQNDFMVGDAPALPDRLNADLLERHTFAFHDRLDFWKKPAGVVVFNFVGYNKKTIAGIREKDGKVSVETTTAGDGTVPLASAETVDSDRTFYIDLKQFDRQHSDLIGDDRLSKQIAGLLTNPTSQEVKKAFKAKPGKTTFEQNSQPVN